MSTATTDTPTYVDLEFNNFLTFTTLDEVVGRVRNIFGKPGVHFSVARTYGKDEAPTLHTHQKVVVPEGLSDFMESDPQGFNVFCPAGVFSFGARTDHKTVTEAYRDQEAGRSFTFVTITGGNGLSRLLNQQIKIYGQNHYGVPFSTVVKVEDISSREAAETEAAYLDKVVALLAERGVSSDVLDILTSEAAAARDEWMPRLSAY